MKHFTLASTVALLLLFAQSALAEGWHFGPTVGYENTSVKWKSEGDTEMDNLSGFNIGAFAEYEPIDYFGIETGVKFVMNGYTMKGLGNYEGQRIQAELKNQLFYFMFPVLVEGKIPLTEDVSINIECGPYLYAGIDSKSSLTVIGESNKISLQEPIFDETLRRFNCQIHLAGGIEYLGFRLMAGYNFGVYDMYIDRSDDTSFFFSGFEINFSYLF